MKKIICLILVALLTMSAMLCLVACDNDGGDEYEDGKLIINLRNLYFNDWQGDDVYTDKIEEKFGVIVRPSTYSWADWESQVYNSANGNNLPDVFHFSLDNYNFAKSYDFWRKGETTRALPDDLSRWPNIQSMLNGISNLDELKVDGKLYCLPIAKNIDSTNVQSVYSPFTYVYRRDWAKELKVYQEGDVYTWEQFLDVVDAFYKAKCGNGDIQAIADVEWGFPSILNFYKTAPHCFTLDGTGKVVANYTTDEFLQGLEVAKQWVNDANKKYYGYDQYAANDGDVAKQYYAGRVGIFYENLSLSNYTTLRNKVKQRSEIDTEEKLDDATAIMKVMGPDGKYALEGGENWYSATFFNADMSDTKMEKILDIMDWLLGEEGTRMAAYGIEGYDYEIDAFGQIQLLETGWEKGIDGDYVSKYNGAKFLRYMCTLGYDMDGIDPLVNKKALAILNDWYAFMDEQLLQGNLRVLEEDPSIKWLPTKNKSTHADGMRNDGVATVTQYVYGKIDLDTYKSRFATETWNKVLSEINENLGK